MKFGAGIAVLVWITLAGALSASAQISATGEGNFRSAKWGQSPAEVKNLEEIPPFYKDKNLLIFHDKFQDTPTEVIYFFLDNRLIMGLTHLLPNHDDLNQYFTDYEKVKAVLGENLGTPDIENWQMFLPDLENDRSLWAEALGFGLIKVETGWMMGDTGIAIRLSGANFKGHLTTLHFSLDDMNAGRLAYKDYFAEEIGVPNEYFRESSKKQNPDVTF